MLAKTVYIFDMAILITVIMMMVTNAKLFTEDLKGCDCKRVWLSYMTIKGKRKTVRLL